MSLLEHILVVMGAFFIAFGVMVIGLRIGGKTPDRGGCVCGNSGEKECGGNGSCASATRSLTQRS